MVSSTRLVGILFLATGISLLVAELFLRENVVLILGAGATFLGIYATAMSTERYVKGDTLVAGCAAGLENLDRIISELGVDGNAVYLPKSYVGEPRVFVPAKRGVTALPDLRGDPTFLTGTDAGELGILISPPGHRLCTLLEEELEIGLDGLEPAAIATMIPPIMSQGLGLAGSVEIDEENLTFTIGSPVCSELCKSGLKACRQVGCPICSSICEALSRSLGVALSLESLDYDGASDMVRASLSRLEG